MTMWSNVTRPPGCRTDRLETSRPHAAVRPGPASTSSALSAAGSPRSGRKLMRRPGGGSSPVPRQSLLRSTASMAARPGPSRLQLLPSQQGFRHHLERGNVPEIHPCSDARDARHPDRVRRRQERQGHRGSLGLSQGAREINLCALMHRPVPRSGGFIAANLFRLCPKKEPRRSGASLG
jgi:hypothetical protein